MLAASPKPNSVSRNVRNTVSVSSLFVSSYGIFSNLTFSHLEYASKYKFLSSNSLKLARSSSFPFCRAARLDFVSSSSFCILLAVVFLSISFAFKLSLRSSTSRFVVTYESSRVCILPSSLSKDFPRLLTASSITSSVSSFYKNILQWFLRSTTIFRADIITFFVTFAFGRIRYVTFFKFL